MKTKAQKRNEARANAEKLKAAKKAVRMSSGSSATAAAPKGMKGMKGKRLVPNSKKKS